MRRLAANACGVIAVTILLILPAASLGALLGSAWGSIGGPVGAYWGAWVGGGLSVTAMMSLIGLEVFG